MLNRTLTPLLMALTLAAAVSPAQAQASGLCDRSKTMVAFLESYFHIDCSRLHLLDLRNIQYQPHYPDTKGIDLRTQPDSFLAGDFYGFEVNGTLAMPKAIKKLREGTFSGLSAETVLFSKWTSLLEVEANAFKGAKSIKKIKIEDPGSYGEKNPLVLDANAFVGLEELETLDIFYSRLGDSASAFKNGASENLKGLKHFKAAYPYPGPEAHWKLPSIQSLGFLEKMTSLEKVELAMDLTTVKRMDVSSIERLAKLKSLEVYAINIEKFPVIQVLNANPRVSVLVGSIGKPISESYLKSIADVIGKPCVKKSTSPGYGWVCSL